MRGTGIRVHNRIDTSVRIATATSIPYRTDSGTRIGACKRALAFKH